MKDTSLVQFVRDRDGQPRGLVVATVIDDKIRLGWSYANTKAGDRFNKEKAYMIAFGRAENRWGNTVKMPHRVKNVYELMALRAIRYFKKNSVVA
jgi:hypothetical protein